MSDLKRGYLNREEENFVMASKSYIMMLNGLRNLDNKITEPIWKDWEKRGMITPSMQKSIKMVNTYLNKFVDELQMNMEPRESKKLEKRLEKFDFRIMDEYSLRRLNREVNNKNKFVSIEINKFFEIMEPVSGVECVGCKKDYKTCALCKAFEDANIDYLGEQPNCPYAADLSEFTPEQKERHEKLIERVRANNKFMK